MLPSGPCGDGALAAPPPPWAALDAELDLWTGSGRQATFWWRDDDAGAVCPAFDRLLALAARHRVPLALAVIPARATQGLAGRIAVTDPGVVVLQHGWSHANHAADGKQTELSDHRAPAETAADLTRGRESLRGLFGARALAVMVPPWNRADPGVTAALPALGFAALSGHGPRPIRPGAAPAPRPVNIHIDIMDWHGSGGFLGEAAVLDQALRHLAMRRTGQADPDEPTGLMTHHLNHDEAGWAFLDRFFAVTIGHPAVRWVGGPALFASEPVTAVPAGIAP